MDNRISRSVNVVRVAQPLPAAALSAIERNVPAVRHLPPELRAKLESLMAVFIAGCGQ